MEPQSKGSESEVGYSAFISHASVDRAKAETICHHLEASGFRCWIAPRDVRLGQQYPDEIMRGILGSRNLILVLTKAANESRDVISEVERARKYGREIFTIRIEEVQLCQALEYLISISQWIDASTGPLTDHIERLAGEIGGQSVPEKAAVTVRRTAAWHQTVPSHVATIAFVVFAFLIGFGFYYFTTKKGTTNRQDSSLAEHTTDEQATNDSKITQTKTNRSPTAKRGEDENTIIESRSAKPNMENPSLLTYKTLALQPPEWFACDNGLCSFYSLRNFFPAVKRIHFGETRNNLDRVFEITQPEGVLDQQTVKSFGDRYYLKYIPMRRGAEGMYVQLEFYDGSKSDLKPARIEPEPSYRKAVGVRLKPIEAPPGVKSPPLFAAYPSRSGKLEFTPDPPHEAKSVKYSFDEGGFFLAEPQKSNQNSRGYYSFEGPVLSNHVRLQFTTNDNKEMGPFKYTIEDPTSLVLKFLKTRFNVHLGSAIDCKRANFTIPDKQAGRTADINRARGLLSSEGLRFITDPPIVVCLPTRKIFTGENSLENWAAVREIHIGTRPRELNKVLPINLNVANVIEGKIPRHRERSNIWKATFPADTESVYVRLSFRDGETSDEIRLPVENIRK